MKKFLIFIVGIILWNSCDNVHNKYKNVPGIVTAISIDRIYNPVIQQYDNIYKYNIAVNDTNIVIYMKVKYQIGDTIPLIKYE